ncbi:MAG TPA: hypothetical protein VG839_04930 [Asticcacaulis sp.]|nr:hypothetical protein [Asticcacaulis sp.]
MALLTFAATLWAVPMLNDGDTFWHIAAGGWMIDHRAVLHSDPFSFTFAGKPWTTHEWLSEVVMALGFRLAGWTGLMVLAAAAMAMTVFLTARVAARWLSGLALWLTVFLGLSMIGPHLLVRPHLLALPLMAAWLGELIEARVEYRAPRLLFLPVMALWANMHGSFLIGLGFILPVALEAVLAAPVPERKRTAASWALFAVPAAAACLLTPHGLDGVIFPIKLLFMPGLDSIHEWAPPDLLKPGPLQVTILAATVVLIRYRVKVPVVRLIVLGGLLILTLRHQRHEMILGLAGAMLLAEPLSRAFKQQAPVMASRRADGWLVVASLAVALIGIRLSLPMTEVHTAQTPAGALAAVPADVRREPVLNTYDFGGYLIAHGVRPFIDGRTDLYGAAFMARYDKIMAADPTALERVLHDYHIGWTILRRNSAAAVFISRLPDWRTLYSDSQFVVQVKMAP